MKKKKYKPAQNSTVERIHIGKNKQTDSLAPNERETMLQNEIAIHTICYTHAWHGMVWELIACLMSVPYWIVVCISVGDNNVCVYAYKRMSLCFHYCFM